MPVGTSTREEGRGGLPEWFSDNGLFWEPWCSGLVRCFLGVWACFSVSSVLNTSHPPSRQFPDLTAEGMRVGMWKYVCLLTFVLGFLAALTIWARPRWLKWWWTPHPWKKLVSTPERMAFPTRWVQYRLCSGFLEPSGFPGVGGRLVSVSECYL